MQRKIKEVKYSPKFLKHLSKLPDKIINKAQEKEAIFKDNCFDPRLKTHKLSGAEKDIWAFWADYSYRIKFIFLIDDDEVIFLDVGTHDIYD